MLAPLSLLLTLPLVISSRVPPPPPPNLQFSPQFSPSPEHDYTVQWSTTSEHLYVKVTAATLGWIGFGIAEGGGMKGADLAVLWVDDEGVPHAEDYFSESNSYPTKDAPNEVTSASCDVNQEPAAGHQSLVAFSGEQTAAHTTVTFGRMLDTNDKQDHPIVDNGDATRLLFSYGDGDSDVLGYHGVNRGTFRMNLFQLQASFDPIAHLRADPTVKEFLFLNDNLNIDTKRTTYTDVELDLSGDADRQIVGFEHILDEGHADLVHHFILTAHKVGDNVGATIWPWASGVVAFAFPPTTGFSIGATADFKSLNLNCHFDNPNNLSGLRDNSGIRVFYVEKEHFREHEIGILQVGDPSVLLSQTDDKEIADGRSQYTFTCPGTCTDMHLGDTGDITLISAQLHMHAIGDAIKLEHVRAGEVINTFKTEFYDYAFQDVVPSSEAMGIVIKPGDGFVHECVYNYNSASEGRKFFGPASDDEMCMAFLMYYPKHSDINRCGINEGIFTNRRSLEGKETLEEKVKEGLATFEPSPPISRDQRAATECADNEVMLTTFTGGFLASCSKAVYFCYDDSILMSYGLPAGLYESTCCATCAAEKEKETVTKCDHEDGLMSLLSGHVCADTPNYCVNDALFQEGGAPAGFFGVICCKTCEGIEYENNDYSAACFGGYKIERMGDSSTITFREFGGDTGECLDVDVEEEVVEDVEKDVDLDDVLLGGGSSAKAVGALALIALSVLATL